MTPRPAFSLALKKTSDMNTSMKCPFIPGINSFFVIKAASSSANEIMCKWQPNNPLSVSLSLFVLSLSLSPLQLFKGKFHHCEGLDTKNITNKSQCEEANYRWIRRKYNFDNLIQVRFNRLRLRKRR